MLSNDGNNTGTKVWALLEVKFHSGVRLGLAYNMHCFKLDIKNRGKNILKHILSHVGAILYLFTISVFFFVVRTGWFGSNSELHTWCPWTRCSEATEQLSEQLT